MFESLQLWLASIKCTDLLAPLDGYGVDSVEDLKMLEDKHISELRFETPQIALKWPLRDCVRWEIGKVTHAGQHKGSFVMRFEDGIEYYWPKLPNSQYGGTKDWVLIAETET